MFIHNTQDLITGANYVYSLETNPMVAQNYNTRLNIVHTYKSSKKNLKFQQALELWLEITLG